MSAIRLNGTPYVQNARNAIQTDADCELDPDNEAVFATADVVVLLSANPVPLREHLCVASSGTITAEGNGKPIIGLNIVEMGSAIRYVFSRDAGAWIAELPTPSPGPTGPVGPTGPTGPQGSVGATGASPNGLLCFSGFLQEHMSGNPVLSYFGNIGLDAETPYTVKPILYPIANCTFTDMLVHAVDGVPTDVTVFVMVLKDGFATGMSVTFTGPLPPGFVESVSASVPFGGGGPHKFSLIATAVGTLLDPLAFTSTISVAS